MFSFVLYCIFSLYFSLFMFSLVSFSFLVIVCLAVFYYFSSNLLCLQQHFFFVDSLLVIVLSLFYCCFLSFSLFLIFFLFTSSFLVLSQFLVLVLVLVVVVVNPSLLFFLSSYMSSESLRSEVLFLFLFILVLFKISLLISTCCSLYVSFLFVFFSYFLACIYVVGVAFLSCCLFSVFLVLFMIL